MTREERDRRRAGINGAVPFGLALIAVGVILILDNLDLVDASALLAGWWPVALIVAGLWWSVTGAPLSGLFVIAVGVLLLATTQDVVDVELGNLIFPALLVIVGGALLQAGWKVRSARVSMASVTSGWPRPGSAPGEPSATAVFGDARLIVSDDGADLDRRLVTATAVFGDVSIEVPAGWRVVDNLTRVLGDVSIPRDQPHYPESPTVEVHGLCIFGDVTVRYVDLTEGAR